MPSMQKQVFEAARQLPKKLRARLAQEMIESLEEAEIIDAHIDEAERRWQNFKQGKTKGIPAEEIFPNLKKKTKKTK